MLQENQANLLKIAKMYICEKYNFYEQIQNRNIISFYFVIIFQSPFI